MWGNFNYCFCKAVTTKMITIGHEQIAFALVRFHINDLAVQEPSLQRAGPNTNTIAFVKPPYFWKRVTWIPDMFCQLSKCRQCHFIWTVRRWWEMNFDPNLFVQFNVINYSLRPTFESSHAMIAFRKH